MPFTQKQARDQYIINSVAQFLGRNLVPAYNAEVAGRTDIASTPLRIVAGKTDDLETVLAAPSIAITMSHAKADLPYEIGTAADWRSCDFLFTCYPALSPDGQPSDVAHHLLRSYMRDSFGGEVIRVLDYSNPAFSPTNILFCQDVLYITSVGAPADSGVSSTLAQERHRFLFRVKIDYVVYEVLFT